MPATASGTTVPLFFPGETSPRDVPYEEMRDNISKYGAKPGVIMKFKDDPEQKSRAVPADQVLDAAKNGGSVVPLGEQQAKANHPGFWASVKEDLSGLLHPSAVSPYPGMDLEAKQALAQQGRSDDQARKAEGQSHFYRVLNLVGQAAGVNERGMAKSAEEGDTAGVLGHAVAPLIPLAAGAAVRVAPEVADYAGVGVTKATAPIRAVIKGANKAMAKAPGTVGGAIGAGIGGKIAGQPGMAFGTIAGTAAGQELLPQIKLPGEGFGLPNRVAGGPVDAPGFSPPEAPPTPPAEPPPVPPAPEVAPVALAPSPAVPRAMPKPAAVEAQLSTALGGKPLKPNVPLRNQMNLPSAAAKLPEGFTPTDDSSLLKGYKYDSDAKEFTAILKNGQSFTHGEVSPEQVDAFQRADSAGAAWTKEIKQGPGTVLVGKNGRPVIKSQPADAPDTAAPDSTTAPPTPVKGSPAVPSPAVPKAMPEPTDDLTGDWSKALGDLKAKQSNLGVERRLDTATRQKVSQMSPDAMRKTLLTSEKTGLPNRRAFDESDPSPAVGMSDADGLKALNDKFGYEAGDALLKAKGEAFQEAGVDAYHDKGDEFLQKGGDDLRAKMEKARENLRNKVIQFEAADGTIKRFKGADFSYGIGESTDEAEQGLKSHKTEREARGERARGELRGIVEQ